MQPLTAMADLHDAATRHRKRVRGCRVELLGRVHAETDQCETWAEQIVGERDLPFRVPHPALRQQTAADDARG